VAGLLGNLLKRLRDLSANGLDLVLAGGVPQSVLEVIKGNTVGLDGILELDDFAIWVLVSRIKEITRGEHERLKKLFPTGEESLGVKLLVPREARESVENLILGQVMNS